MPWEDEAEGGLIKIFNEAVSGGSFIGTID